MTTTTFVFTCIKLNSIHLLLELNCAVYDTNVFTVLCAAVLFVTNLPLI